MRVTFFCFAKKKSPKKKRPCCACPFAALRATCDARAEGAPQNSLRATRSVQTTAASQCSKCVRPSAHARTPCPALLGTHRREPRARTSTQAIAALGLYRARGCNRHAQRRRSRAQRWPVRLLAVGCWLLAVGCWLSSIPTHLAAPAWRRFRGGMRVGARMLSPLTRRGCSSAAPKARSEFHGAPRNRHGAGLPRSNAKGSLPVGRLSFGYFSLAKQRTSASPAGATPGLRTPTKHAAKTSAQARASTS